MFRWIVWLCAFPVLCLPAQQYGFRQYSLAEGVAQSQVFALLEDHQGYLWLGTQGGGVNRWDGLGFQRYSVKDGLASGKIHCLAQRRNREIWIGTSSGFSRYDGASFQSYDFSTGRLAVYAMCEGVDQMWLGTSQGLWSWRGDSLLEPVTAVEGVVKSISQRGDSLWVGTSLGLRLLVGDSLRAIPTGISPTRPIEVLRHDPQGQLWVGAYGKELLYLRGNAFHPFALPWQESDLSTDLAWNRAGELWVSSQGQGAARWSPSEAAWVTFGSAEGLPNRYVKTLLVDSRDHVWMGTSGSGLCRYTGLPFVHVDRQRGLPEQAVYALLEDRDCRIWMGNGQTLGYLEGERFVNLNQHPGFQRSKFKSMLQDRAGRIWLGSEGKGVALYTDSTFLWFDQQHGLSSDWVRSLAEAPDGSLVVGTANSGLCSIRLREDSLAQDWEIQCSRIQPSLPEANINQILYDRAGHLWVATRNLGLLEQWPDGRWKRHLLEAGPAARTLRSLAFGDQGRIWIGTEDAGLLRATPSGDSLAWLWYRDELPSEIVYLLAFDEYGSLWIGTEQGMDRATLDEDGNVIDVAHFAQEEGFLGIETCQNAALMDREGRMWFGTVNGVGRWQAGLNRPQGMAPKLLVEEARLFYTPLAETSYRSAMGAWGEIFEKLVLSHRNNHLSFDLLGIDHDRPSEVLYQWRLVGSELDWSPPSKRRSTTFSNLPPGDYLFLARAGLPEGPWSAPVEVAFEILPPFWARWWFRIGSLTLLLLVLGGVFRFRLNQVRTRSEAERQRIQLERDMLELEQKALRLQMNPHFIFNALNSIQGLIIREDPQSARYYLAKFSRLMRQVLENSRHPQVSLDEELQVLEDYLALEQFSRGGAFTYTIGLGEEIDAEEERLPPMLLQPFLENAIIHGIAHLTDRAGIVSVHITRRGDHLHCEITDNGVGRQRASHIKSQQQAQHKSMALQVTQERLERLALARHALPHLQVEDLVLPDGRPAGTKVVLRIFVGV